MNIESYKPCFGDHLLITLTVDASKVKNVQMYKRDWRNYSKVNLINMLNNLEWCTDIDNVQELWNDIEMIIVRIVDEIVPLTEMTNNRVPKQVPTFIKSKIDKRNRLIKLRKSTLQVS